MKEFKEFAANYNSIISHLFYGILEAKSQCMEGATLLNLIFKYILLLNFL